MHVVIVEDSSVVELTLRTAIEAQGCTVQSAGRLADVVGGLNSCMPSFFLIDRELPDGDGLSLVRALRAAGFEGGILVLSGREETRSRIEGLRAGADDYVLKPFHVPELLQRMDNICRRRCARPTRIALELRPATAAYDAEVDEDEGPTERLSA